MSVGRPALPVSALTTLLFLAPTFEQAGLAREFALDQNYPNPFNPTTTIRYPLQVRSSIVLNVYDALGQNVAELARGEKEAGCHEVQFDASRLASSVYSYHLTAGDHVQARRLVLIR